MFPGQLALTYDLDNTAGATGGSVTLTPVGLNAAPRTDTVAEARVRSTVLSPYTPGRPGQRRVHVVFLTPEGVQDDSADPFVVSYPS